MTKKEIDDLKLKRIGEISYNKKESLMQIIQYNNAKDILVEFQDEFKFQTRCNYSNFIIGAVKNPYSKTFFNVGYKGDGIYKAKSNSKNTIAYSAWIHMLIRCYDKEHRQEYPTYKDCTVCEEWHNFQNFAEWYYKNYYEIDDEKMCLDKDILIKGNKIYSFKTCIIVPERINILFEKSQKARGDCPIGVYYYKSVNKYTATFGKMGQAQHLGYFDNSEEAFLAYKQAKESYIKEIADEYMLKYPDVFPQKLYNAMYAYQVENTD